MSYTKQLKQTEQITNITMMAKALRPKLVRIIDILKGNVLSLTIIADKILLKTIKATISNYLIYMPKVIRLFFKPFLLPFIEPY